MTMADDCILWTGRLTNYGYGQLLVDGHWRVAHRVAYEQAVGPIPKGMTLDHLCRVRNCINPDHLEPVSHRENILRGEGIAARYARRTHCAQGHEFTPENTMLRKEGGRRCRTCMREHNRVQWVKRRSRT